MPNPTFFIVTIAFIISLFFIKKFKKTSYIYFIVFLGLTFITELLSSIENFYYIKDNEIIYRAEPIYNVFLIITFNFYFLFYKNLFKKNNGKKVALIFLVIYNLFVLIDFFILKTNYLDTFSVNSVVLGSILFVIILILFLVEIINNEKIVFNIKKAFIFWISIGALLFYIGVIPILISSEYLGFNGLYHFILTPLNIIMYGCFSIGFIFSDIKYNY